MSDELSLCCSCDREYRTEIQEVNLCPACEAKVTQFLREEVAYLRAALQFTEAQRSKLRKLVDLEGVYVRERTALVAHEGRRQGLPGAL
jgi:hypothetical protein